MPRRLSPCGDSRRQGCATGPFLSHVVQLWIVLNPGKSNYWVLGKGCIDPSYYRLTQFIWNDFDKFRTGPRTTPTVSATRPRICGKGGGRTASAAGAKPCYRGSGEHGEASSLIRGKGGGARPCGPPPLGSAPDVVSNVVGGSPNNEMKLSGWTGGARPGRPPPP